VSTSKDTFAGPGKTDEELEFVLSNAIGEIHVESLREAERISTLSRLLGRRARIAVRVILEKKHKGERCVWVGKLLPLGMTRKS